MKEATVVSRKVAILGFRAVGKSSLTNSFVLGSFSKSYDPTIESTLHKTIRFRKVHFATDIVDTAGMVRMHKHNVYLTVSLVYRATHNNQSELRTIHCVLFSMWSKDEYSRLSRNASLGVHGYILVFSIASRQSFEIIKQANELLLSTLGDAPDVPRVLVGSMKDLSQQRQVSQAVSIKFYVDAFIEYVYNHLYCFPQNWCDYSTQDAQQLADLWGVPYIECSNKTGEAVAEVFHTLIKEIEKDDGLLAEKNEGGCALQWQKLNFCANVQFVHIQTTYSIINCKSAVSSALCFL